MYDKPYEQKPNSGSLFISKTKKSEKSPDYYGEILVNVRDFDVSGDTVKIRVAGWKKQSRNGSNFLSLAVSPSEDQPVTQSEPTSLADVSEDIPF